MTDSSSSCYSSSKIKGKDAVRICLKVSKFTPKATKESKIMKNLIEVPTDRSEEFASALLDSNIFLDEIDRRL